MTYGSLKAGQWFIYGDCVYVKTDKEESIKFTFQGNYVERSKFNTTTEVSPVSLNFKIQ